MHCVNGHWKPLIPGSTQSSQLCDLQREFIRLQLIDSTFANSSGRQVWWKTYVTLQLGAAEPRQHQIENQQIVLVGFNKAQAFATVCGKVDREALGSKASCHEVRKLAVIFNNEQSHDYLPEARFNGPKITDSTTLGLHVAELATANLYPGQRMVPEDR